jgi:hypothetical protein
MPGHNQEQGRSATGKKRTMTAASLREKPVRDLAKLAKKHGVPGWHAMRKDQLIKALVRRAKAARPASTTTNKNIVAARSASKTAAASSLTKPAARASRPAAARAAMANSVEGERKPSPAARKAAQRRAAVTERIRDAQARLAREKNLASRPEPSRKQASVRDRAVLMARGPHWLHAHWEITPRSVERVQAALGEEWHAAKPVLRLIEVVSAAAGSPSARVVREIEIHGGVKNWFIDIRDPLRCRTEVGYRTRHGEFHPLCRSNVVTIPSGSQGDTLDAHWGDIAANCDKIYAMSGGFSPENHPEELRELFEERLKRPLGLPVPQRPALDGKAGTAGEAFGFPLEVDAEMVVYGVTEKGAHLTIQGEPVTIEDDGGFRVRVEMPNKRQVIPITAKSATGLEQQTVVLAIERNTKAMEPHLCDAEDT